jgi:hypothetical protein
MATRFCRPPGLPGPGHQGRAPSSNQCRRSFTPPPEKATVRGGSQTGGDPRRPARRCRARAALEQLQPPRPRSLKGPTCGGEQPSRRPWAVCPRKGVAVKGAVPAARGDKTQTEKCTPPLPPLTPPPLRRAAAHQVGDPRPYLPATAVAEPQKRRCAAKSASAHSNRGGRPPAAAARWAGVLPADGSLVTHGAGNAAAIEPVRAGWTATTFRNGKLSSLTKVSRWVSRADVVAGAPGDRPGDRAAHAGTAQGIP